MDKPEMSSGGYLPTREEQASTAAMQQSSDIEREHLRWVAIPPR